MNENINWKNLLTDFVKDTIKMHSGDIYDDCIEKDFRVMRHDHKPEVILVACGDRDYNPPMIINQTRMIHFEIKHDFIEKDLYSDEEYQRLLGHMKYHFGDNMVDVANQYKEKCISWDYGTNRIVFIMSDMVVKIPYNISGYLANCNEAAGQLKCRVPCARTRSYYIEGHPIVFMELVDDVPVEEVIFRLGFYPDWAYDVDMQQVGFTKSGRLVAYDFG